jgi:hypothetical protein
MKFLLVFPILLVHVTFAQPLKEFNEERLKTDERLMLTLGSWSVANFVGGGIGWAVTEKGEAQYFHQMNVLWNTVNVGLALPGYLKAKRANPELSLAQTIAEQHRNEKIFLFNAGLDLMYISAGVILRSEAKTNLERRDQFNGFGNSLLLQGGFLFLFDLTAHAIHNHHRKEKLSPMMNRLSMSSTGIGLKWELDVPRHVNENRTNPNK